MNLVKFLILGLLFSGIYGDLRKLLRTGLEAELFSHLDQEEESALMSEIFTELYPKLFTQEGNRSKSD